MCGIIAAASESDVVSTLLNGLYKMEYRGYDSAGLAIQDKNSIEHIRTLGKVKKLEVEF